VERASPDISRKLKIPNATWQRSSTWGPAGPPPGVLSSARRARSPSLPVTIKQINESNQLLGGSIMAERKGFEPLMRFPPNAVSVRALVGTKPPFCSCSVKMVLSPRNQRSLGPFRRFQNRRPFCKSSPLVAKTLNNLSEGQTRADAGRFENMPRPIRRSATQMQPITHRRLSELRILVIG